MHFLLLLAITICSTNDSSTSKAGHDYIGKPALENVVEVYTGKDAYDFKLHPFNSGKNPNDILQSKSTLYAGMYVQYKWFSFDYSTSILNSTNDPSHSIKAFNFGSEYIKDKWGVIGAMHKYQGFIMVSNPKRTRTVLPQLKYLAVDADAYVNLNSQKFSMQAAYTYGRQQLRSAAGMSLWLHSDYQRWNFMPTVSNKTVQIKQGDARPADRITNIYNLIPEASYGYNWVINKRGLLATALIHAGAGYSYTIDKSATLMPSWRAGWHLQAGYNGNKWYTYFSEDGVYQNYLSASRFLYNQQVSNSITVGRRF